ncbi:hypothetical protein BFW38_04945 [Terasakiispira papahanaumokuakeensis]|uniref:HTH marR-type domain-containing protein n=2 Tax=Terasakiispira papahanaumokuakeensis TaxID=197479 RepID=A0A1E2VEC8_9GAMM|nr:hypothetical protein BFW38_04945 [Terasakiispira papahanaumokuakeensis]
MDSSSQSKALGLRLRHIHRLWRTVVDHTVKPLQLTQPRWMTLVMLHHLGQGVSQRVLAQALEVEMSSLSRTLDQLSRQGLVDRNVCSADRRAREIGLTEAGQKVLMQLDQQTAQVRQALLSGISKEALEVFEQVLDQIECNAQRCLQPVDE